MAEGVNAPRQGHPTVVRTFRDEPGAAGEPEARWFGVSEVVPERIARAAVAGGELPDSAAALEAHRRAAWPVETVMADTEAAVVLGAVRRLLAGDSSHGTPIPRSDDVAGMSGSCAICT